MSAQSAAKYIAQPYHGLQRLVALLLARLALVLAFVAFWGHVWTLVVCCAKGGGARLEF